MQDVFFLTCGTLRVPAFAVGPSVRVSPFRGVGLSVTVAVVQRPDGELALVDAGWSAEACASPMRTFGPARWAYLRPRVRPADAIAAQLGALGFDTRRVRTIVATHLHLDHIGGAVDFPNAEVVCTDLELAAYRGKKHLGYRAADLAKTGRVRTVTMTSDPSYGFPASHDLFGDGGVVLLDARGHTRGSVAVALRSARGAWVHVGDAAFQAWEYGIGGRGPSLLSRLHGWDGDAISRAQACLRACQVDPRRPVIVPSHDEDVLATLPRAPLTTTN